VTDEPLDVLISTALTDQLRTPALTSPATPIAFPFAPYTPASGVSYLAVRPLLRASPDHPGIAFDAFTMHRGIFQVDVVTPDTHGENPGLRLAALVAARFAIGTELVAGTYRLQLNSEPTIAAAVMDAPWVRFPVSIPYLVIK